MVTHSNPILTKINASIGQLIFNKPEVHNAFDDYFIQSFASSLQALIANSSVSIIMISANGDNFSSGADLHWMANMAQMSNEDNIKDAKLFANLLYNLYNCIKPTICLVQGKAFGGALGIIACCDIAFATTEAIFSFSEVKLGLIPAVISPFIIKSIGSRTAKNLFITGSTFNATQAKAYGLITDVSLPSSLVEDAFDLAQQILKNAPKAVQEAKHLIHTIADKPINIEMINYCANKLAHIRKSTEAQKGIYAFLNKTKPIW